MPGGGGQLRGEGHCLHLGVDHVIGPRHRPHTGRDFGAVIADGHVPALRAADQRLECLLADAPSLLQQEELPARPGQLLETPRRVLLGARPANRVVRLGQVRAQPFEMLARLNVLGLSVGRAGSAGQHAGWDRQSGGCDPRSTLPPMPHLRALLTRTSLYNRKQSSKRSATSVESCDTSASRWRAADRLALVARSTSSCAALRARRQEARQAQSRTSSRMRQTALNQ